MVPTDSLSIALPCFNEQHNLERVVSQAVEVGRVVTKRLEVIVVDDGSTDDSPAVLHRLRDRYPELRLIRHPDNRGYGAALRSAFAAARHQHVFFTDGDGQFDLTELPHALGLLREHDVVTGYRRQRRDDRWRRLCGWLWTRLANLALGLRVRDMNCAFKILPRALVAEERLVSTGALISAELVSKAHRRGLSIGEVGVTHLPRKRGRATGGSARVALTAAVELCRVAVATRRRDSGRDAWLRRASRRSL